MSSSTGAASYSVPIEVPKGRNGITPNLALNYNSYQPNGWVGVGWTLDMGAIQRSTKATGGLNYNSNQFVAVSNGNTSNLVARPDWGANNYENQIDATFLNYNFIFSASGWQVKDKSGTTYYYGSNPAANSQQQNSYGTFKWLLDKVVDVNGNYMTVTYSTDGGQVYLQRIDYTGNYNGGGLATTNYILFDTTSRSDVQVSYASGTAVTTEKLLSGVEVYGNNGTLIRKYVLSYNASTTTSRSLLQSVTQYGSDGQHSLPPLTFNWQVGSTGFGLPSSYPSAIIGTNPRTVDLNGDGKADLVYESDNTSSTSNFRVRLSTGSLSTGPSFGAETVWGQRTSTYNSQCPPRTNWPTCYATVIRMLYMSTLATVCACCSITTGRVFRPTRPLQP